MASPEAIASIKVAFCWLISTLGAGCGPLPASLLPNILRKLRLLDPIALETVIRPGPEPVDEAISVDVTELLLPAGEAEAYAAALSR